MARKTPFKSKGRRTTVGLAFHKTEMALLDQKLTDLYGHIENRKISYDKLKQDHSAVMMGLHKDLHEAQQDLAITKRERDAAQNSAELRREFSEALKKTIERDRLTINALIGYKEA